MGSRRGHESGQRHPRLGRRASDRYLDKPHRHFEFLVQAAPEQVAQRPEGLRGIRKANPPRGLDIRGRLIGNLERHGEQPYLRIVRIGQDAFVIQHAPTVALRRHGHVHVGLTGADPDLAHENVPPLDRVGAGDGHFERAACSHGRQPHLPPSLLIGGGLRAASGHRNLHLLARSSRAPDRHLSALLEDHAVAEQRVDRHLGVRLGRPSGQARNRKSRQETHTMHRGFLHVICLPNQAGSIAAAPRNSTNYPDVTSTG